MHYGEFTEAVEEIAFSVKVLGIGLNTYIRNKAVVMNETPDL